MRRGAVSNVVHGDTRFAPGDLVTVVGTERDLGAAVAALGHLSAEHIEHDRSEIDYRRMFVSNPLVEGVELGALDLGRRFDAAVTRVRRGDVDIVPEADFRIEPGDRVRVVAPKRHMAELEQLFGDSQRRVAEIDVLTFGLGIALGLLLGAVPFPLPGGKSFELGLAGGPLIAGLVLGQLGRTGPLVWTLPFGANLTLRQLGIVLFLAGVGVRAGGSLGGALDGDAAVATVWVGVVVTALASLLTLGIARLVLGVPAAVAFGLLAGIQTQPAVLAFAVEKTGKDAPNLGYTSVYPIATVGKILLAQVLLGLR